MPSMTAMPQPMLMASIDPLALLLSTVCATTPTPKAIRMKVPKNSAAASRAVPLSMRAILFRFRSDHYQMLPGKSADDLVDLIAFRFHLLLHLRHAHLVHFENWDLRIFLAELEQHQAAAWLERGLEALQEDLRLLQLVIDVDHDREIDRGRRQLRIVHAAEHCCDVSQTFRLDATLEQRDHARLNVGRIHTSGRTNTFRDAR